MTFPITKLWYVSIAICTALCVDIGLRVWKRLNQDKHIATFDGFVPIALVALIAGTVWPVTMVAAFMWFIVINGYERTMLKVSEIIAEKFKH